MNDIVHYALYKELIEILAITIIDDFITFIDNKKWCDIFTWHNLTYEIKLLNFIYKIMPCKNIKYIITTRKIANLADISSHIIMQCLIDYIDIQSFFFFL